MRAGGHRSHNSLYDAAHSLYIDTRFCRLLLVLSSDSGRRSQSVGGSDRCEKEECGGDQRSACTDSREHEQHSGEGIERCILAVHDHPGRRVQLLPFHPRVSLRSNSPTLRLHHQVPLSIFALSCFPLFSIGCCVPGPGAPQEAIMEVMISDMELPAKKAALFAKIGESSGIDRRYSVLPSIESIYFGRKGLGNNEVNNTENRHMRAGRKKLLSTHVDLRRLLCSFSASRRATPSSNSLTTQNTASQIRCDALVLLGPLILLAPSLLLCLFFR